MEKPTASSPPDKVRALARLVTLQSVRFVRTETEFKGLQAGDVLDQLKLESQAGGFKSPDQAQAIRIIITLRCSLVAKGTERAVAEVACNVALDYALSDEAAFNALTDEEILLFAVWNGAYHAWPYLREFCQASSLRMGLPVPIILPTLPPAPKLADTGIEAKPKK